MMTKSIVASVCLSSSLLGADQLTQSTNELGLKLYQDLSKEGENLCFSPYSIQSALSMASNGAAGKTAKEMQYALQHKVPLNQMNSSFKEYRESLAKRLAKSEAHLKKEERLQLSVANKLFGKAGYPIKKNFLDSLKQSYDAPLESLDFGSAPEPSRKLINAWVSDQTQEKIKNLLPAGSITPLTKLVLTNCLHFKASWQSPFKKHRTQKRDFYSTPGKAQKVPMMATTASLGYQKAEGYQAVTLPYRGAAGFQFFVILPDEGKSLTDVVAALKNSDLVGLKDLPRKRLDLTLPKFKVETPSMPLTKPMQKLGMVSAFDDTVADFSNMSDQKRLCVTSIYHKAFIELDEKGTEAAAATAVVIGLRSMPTPTPKPLKVEVNRPFFYGIQDTKTGNCLFLGNIQKL